MHKENFEKAFGMRIGCRMASCECGKIFINPNGSWDWDDLDLDELIHNPAITKLDWSVSFVGFEGKEYVVDCNCWIDRARRIGRFIETHGHAIAEYLRLEKNRAAAEAEAMPAV